ncbi:MAG: YccF domain-containing protein [Asticcacaulis sp.]
MSLILNILWFVFGGFIMGLVWCLGGCLLAITIIGLPWAGAAFRIAGFSFFPFGRAIADRDIHTGREDMGTGVPGALLNIIWILLGGWYIALGHLTLAVAQAITIIGIPFAIKNVQLAWLALAPVGKIVVEKP